MNYFDLKLDLDYEGLHLGDGHRAWMTCYIPSNFKEFSEGRNRPAVIICPGGGYRNRSNREAEPVALQYLAADMAAFVLHYSVDENAGFPRSMFEALTAVKTVRENAKEWNIDPNQIVILGFSAGGHLAASAAAFWHTDLARNALGNNELYKINAAVLCYPVISSGPKAHRGSFNHLVGEDATPEQLELVSIENRVTDQYPATFLWHTATDATVPVENSIYMAQALAREKILFELHIYPTGVHGLSLSDERTAKTEDGQYKKSMLEKRPRRWVEDSILFLKETVFAE